MYNSPYAGFEQIWYDSIMANPFLELYTDYLISSFSYTTATGLSFALDGAVSHDQVTRWLSSTDVDSKDLWKKVKPLVRAVESQDGVLIFDDTVEEKRYTDENEFITHHFDHTVGRSVKGINLLSCLYHSKGTNVPVSFRPVLKPVKYIDPKTGRERRKSVKTKNEEVREMLQVATCQNQIKYRYVLADVWFSSSETMKYIKKNLKKEFIFPIKSNRLIRLSETPAHNGYQSVKLLMVQEDVPTRVRLEGLSFEVLLLKHVYKNEDGSEGTIYLVCSNLTLLADHLLTIYQKRWTVEEYHKSLKSNLGLNKSPTQTVRTQSSHIFASIVAYSKLELLKTKTHLNHFALKTKLYVKALRTSMDELAALKVQYLC